MAPKPRSSSINVILYSFKIPEFMTKNSLNFMLTKFSQNILNHLMPIARGMCNVFSF
jgi:hypothetical protein